MWIERQEKKAHFIDELLTLDKQVMLVRGARQVGKTSFILNALHGLQSHQHLKINALYPSSFTLDGIDYLGRDFFGKSETGEELLKNIELELGSFDKREHNTIVFIDEVDRYPIIMESIQTLAEFSNTLKFIFTGSNLENIAVKNAATGRKHYFDLYPITFHEFLTALGDEKALRFFDEISLQDTVWSEWAHARLYELTDTYIRLGGMPKILDLYLTSGEGVKKIPNTIKDLTQSIEENVKTVLGDKQELYEYEDVLRKLAFLSMNTLKFSKLQVEHAGQKEAKRLVSKTVGARVAHKIRLFESDSDLSKYILFDCGIVNYLLNGSHLLKNTISDSNRGILYETFVGNELIAGLTSRDDLFYWKSGNQAEVEYVLRSPNLIGIDVKAQEGSTRSLASFALLEPDAAYIVKITKGPGMLVKNYTAKLPNYDTKRSITLISIPHYLTSRLGEFIAEIQ